MAFTMILISMEGIAGYASMALRVVMESSSQGPWKIKSIVEVE